MNALYGILLGIVLITGSGLAQTRSTAAIDDAVPPLSNSDRQPSAVAIKNYERGLLSDNDGVVESSLYYAVRLRLTHPSHDFTTLSRAIDKLVASGRTPSIRYKAYLASTLYAAPALVRIETTSSPESMHDFFLDISEQLRSRLLVRNN
ncbi:MAG TPA: hypothetical protein PK916_03285 [Bacteroidota bacterium]|nr:hypothetical protein [Bacteroidota bacterium]